MSQIQKKTRKDRFIEGLKAYDLTYEEIKASGWKYAGGDWGSHLNYYHLMFSPDEATLPHESECVCGVAIQKNGYICNKKGTEFLILGCCCIKRFIGGRTCEKCGDKHKRHISNICVSCEKFRVWCDKKQKWRYQRTMKCNSCEEKILQHEWKKSCLNCYKIEKSHQFTFLLQ
tara:strand:+ start:352 stop:870 length:519 start_codon:yes stop_codon:yes gene_type:complete